MKGQEAARWALDILAGEKMAGNFWKKQEMILRFSSGRATVGFVAIDSTGTKE
jgi:hypothetical protein